MGTKRGIMKFPYFKSMLAVGALIVAWNCSDTTAVDPNFFQEEARVLQTENGNLYITADNQVKAENGVVIGVLNEDGTITTMDGIVIYENVNKDELEDTTLEYTVSSASTSDNENGNGSDIGGNGTNNSGNNTQPTNPNNTNNNTTQSTNSNNNNNSNTAPVSVSKSDCNPSAEVTGCLTQTVTGGATLESIVFSNANNYPMYTKWNIQEYFKIDWNSNEHKATLSGKAPTAEGTYSDEITVGGKSYTITINVVAGGSSNNNNNQNPTYSSPKSSSSAKSSASVQSSSSRPQSTGPSLLPKVIGQEKDGYATRYWDSCKPHCAWEGKGGPVARTCHADGSKAGTGEASACDGGPAGTCTDQTPQIVNDTIAYAFAATPGGGNDCGKCYMLTFKGTGASATSTPTDDAHRSIKGKHLIVMSNNIGYDVSHNQFDLMIPGGGPGAFNGCSKMGLSCAGEKYGGFLTTCKFDKSCLIRMCNQEYANNTSMKNGCLFLANWMNAANNPEVKFVQVECPSALTAKY